MSEGRAVIYALSTVVYGARPVVVPGRGNVLCASILFPFRLSTGEKIDPKKWSSIVSEHGGPMALPDSMAPLPGAEVVVLGNLSPVVEKQRKARLRCGGLDKELLLSPDPKAEGQPFCPDYSAAIWHEKDNPLGRGGDGEQADLPPLILDPQTAKQPLWLGSTPLDHPTRVKLFGTASDSSGTGYPDDADPSVLYEAHRAFWVDALNPGTALEYEGLSDTDVKTTLPPYRVSIVYGSDKGQWKKPPTRIHSVTLIPSADAAAVIWRTGIDLGKRDSLGESVVVLVAALEDMDSPVQDVEYWGNIAFDRLDDPTVMLDERPLMPKSMAATVKSPFAMSPEESAIQERLQTAKDWVAEETGVSEDSNPFDAPESEVLDAADELKTALDDEEEMPDPSKLDELADTVLAAAKKRHDVEDFEIPDPDKREPVVRGDALEAEMDKRLKIPYCSEKEIILSKQLGEQDSTELNAEDTIKKLADARLKSPQSALYWPALNDEEGRRFGERLVAELQENGSLECHIDVSGAIIDGTDEDVSLSGCQLEGLLAEETLWREVAFTGCTFTRCSFTKGKFENCTFQDCLFDDINLSFNSITNSHFASCSLTNSQSVELVCLESAFQNCLLEKLSFTQLAMRAVNFTGGKWSKVDFSDGVQVEVIWSKVEMAEVTYTAVHVANSRFEKLEMFKVWGMSKGFPGCVFEEVKGTTCGFVGGCHFDEAQFIKTQFIETGFTASVFKDARVGRGCQFNNCDFSGALFENTELVGVRFLRCTMATSIWANVKAQDAWFFESVLRDIDFLSTTLSRAMFADSDVEGAQFQPDQIIGANFQGTVKALE